MAWVTWRQHRAQLVGAAGLLVALAAAALGTRLPIQAAYHRDVARRPACRRAARTGCDLIVPHFEGEFGGWVAAPRGLAVLPGARRAVRRRAAARARARARHAPLRLDAGRHAPPLAALEDGAARRRDAARAARPRARSSMWWRGPFDTLEGRMTPSGFDIEGLVVPAYALFALARRRARRAASSGARSRR